MLVALVFVVSLGNSSFLVQVFVLSLFVVHFLFGQLSPFCMELRLSLDNPDGILPWICKEVEKYPPLNIWKDLRIAAKVEFAFLIFSCTCFSKVSSSSIVTSISFSLLTLSISCPSSLYICAFGSFFPLHMYMFAFLWIAFQWPILTRF